MEMLVALIVSSWSAELLRCPGPGGRCGRSVGQSTGAARSRSQVPLVPCPGEERRVPPPALPPLPRSCPGVLPSGSDRRCRPPCPCPAAHPAGAGRSRGAGRAPGAPGLRAGAAAAAGGGREFPGREGAAPLCNAVPLLQRSPRVSGAAGARRERPPRPALRSAPAAPRFFVNGTLTERAMTSPPGPIGAQWRSGPRRAAGAVIGWRARAGAHAGGGGGRYKGGGGRCGTPRIGGDTGGGTAPLLRSAPNPGKRRAAPAGRGSCAGRVAAAPRLCRGAGLWDRRSWLVCAGQPEGTALPRSVASSTWRVRPGQSAAVKVTAGAPRGAAGKRGVLWKWGHGSRRVPGAGKNEDGVVVVMCSLECKTLML